MAHITYPDPVPFWHAVHGFFDFGDVYQQFVERGADGDVFVEVGCFLGRSACFLGDTIKASGKRITVLAVDVWPTAFDFRDGKGGGSLIEAPYEIFLANVRQANLVNVIVPVRAASVDAARFIRNDLAAVFIDADHEYDGCAADIKAWLPKVRPGGILAGHDFTSTFPGVIKAAREAFGDKLRTMGQCWIYDVPA